VFFISVEVRRESSGRGPPVRVLDAAPAAATGAVAEVRENGPLVETPLRSC